MNKQLKTIVVFLISFITAYLVVGYMNSNMFVSIHWVYNATIWQKLKEYYIRTFSINIMPALIIAVIAVIITSIINGRKRS